MNWKRSALTLVAVCAVGSAAHALYDVVDEGTWPKTWPGELEPLRDQCRTSVGPLAPYMNQHYAIRFTRREEFESAWPHILKVKSEGAPVFLVRSPSFSLDENQTGVVVHSPPADQTESAAEPIPVKDVTQTRINTTYIELVVDGDVVDLNRIPLPSDTPIIDRRFDQEQDQ
jgi:hypothetical protein